jgi:hypothetical protein
MHAQEVRSAGHPAAVTSVKRGKIPFHDMKIKYKALKASVVEAFGVSRMENGKCKAP